MANQRNDMDDRQQEDYWLDYEYQQHLEQQADEVGSK